MQYLVTGYRESPTARGGGGDTAAKRRLDIPSAAAVKPELPARLLRQYAPVLASVKAPFAGGLRPVLTLAAPRRGRAAIGARGEEWEQIRPLLARAVGDGVPSWRSAMLWLVPRARSSS
jgi:hypothetical protein